MTPTAELAKNEIESLHRIRFGLRAKAMVAAGILMACAAFPPLFYFYYLVRSTIATELEEKADAIVLGLAHNAKLPVFVSDTETLGKLSEAVLESPDVLYVAIAGTNGDFLSSKARTRQDGTPVPAAKEALDNLRRSGLDSGAASATRTLSNGDSYYEVTAPVISSQTASTSAANDLDVFGGLEEEGPSAKEQTAAPRTIGVVAIGVSRARAAAKVVALLRRCATVAFLVFFGGLLISWYGTRVAVQPIVKLAASARLMGRGDLTVTIEQTTRDEIGTLAAALAAMAGNLKRVLRGIRDASNQVEMAVEQAGEAAKGITHGSSRQMDAVTSTSAAIHQMDSSIKSVARSSERMSSSVVGTTTSIEELGASVRQIDDSVAALQSVAADVSSSVLEMGANIGEAAESIGELQEQVSRTSSSIQEMATSIQNVDGSAAEMGAAAETTAGAIGDMAKSISQVGSHAQAAVDLAKQASEDVEEGREAVESSSTGTEAIKTRFEEMEKVVEGLGASSQRIGEIVNIIDDIADRTNLLSLNAAIIAAEAGDQGKAFAVVAEEIGDLAVKTAGSTRDIAVIIKKVRSAVKTAMESMKESRQAVAEGVELAGRAKLSLDRIRKGAKQTLAMGQQIADATVLQLEQSETMTKQMARLQEQADTISRATREQSKGSSAITDAVTEMSEKADLVKKASVEQRLGGERISEGMEEVTRMVAQIARATKEQTQNSKLIMDAANEVETLSLEVGRATREQTESSSKVVESVEVIQQAGSKNTDLAATLERQLLDLRGSMSDLAAIVKEIRFD